MRVIAFYLPQYHRIKENDEWWGEGFTEWTNLKKGKALFKGHYQPRIPLHRNYYNLLDSKVQEWQCKIAKEHGIYGFCFYHYWFNGKLLLEKPVEQYLHNEKCDIPFCICWANEHWTNQWVSSETKVLIAQEYGNREQWKAHFDYLLQFFLSDRYIKENNKPFVVIYRPELIDCLNDMLDYWQELAKENGFDGLVFAYQHPYFGDFTKKDDSRFAYAIEYQPGYALKDHERQKESNVLANIVKFKRKINLFLEKYFNCQISLRNYMPAKIRLQNYDEIWTLLLNRTPPTNKYIPGAFTDWDNSPRKGERGLVFVGASPQKFRIYFEKLIIRAKEIYHKDTIFIFAWNEWTEGGYLEPDEKWGYGYLEAIKQALLATGEFPGNKEKE